MQTRHCIAGRRRSLGSGIRRNFDGLSGKGTEGSLLFRWVSGNTWVKTKLIYRKYIGKAVR